MRNTPVILVVALSGLLLSACGGAITKCTKDTDCKAGNVCSGDTCTPRTDDGGSGGGTGGGTGGGAGGGTGGGAGGGTGGAGGNGETCATATAVTVGSTSGDTSGARNDLVADDASCTGAPNVGADRVYVVTVPAGQRLTARVTPESAASGEPQFDSNVYLIEGPASNCHGADAGIAVTCLAGADSANAAAADMASWTNNGASPKEVFIVVDSAVNPPDSSVTDHGRFTLEVTLGALPGDDTCAAPKPLTSGATLAAEVIDTYGNDYSGTGVNCAGGAGPDRVYSASVPAGQMLTVTVTPTQTLDLAISFVDRADRCGLECLDSADAKGPGMPETLTWANTGTTPKTMLVVVDSFLAGHGTFDLVATIVVPPPGDTCDTATVLDAGVTLANQTTAGFTNAYDNSAGSSGCVFGTIGPDHAYVLQVPASKRATVTVSPATNFDPSLNLVEGAAPAACAVKPRVCAAGNDGSGVGAAEVVSVNNGGSASKQYYAIVDSSLGTGAYDIGLVIDTPPVGDFCGSAAPLVSGTPATNQNLTNFAKDYGQGTDCRTHSGPDRVYAISLDPGKRLAATVTPTTDGGFDPVLSFMDGPATNCEGPARVCTASVDTGSTNDSESASYVNAGGSAKTVFVVVGSYSASPTDTAFTLAATVSTPPVGDTCQNPTPANLSGTMSAQKTAGLLRDYQLRDYTCWTKSTSGAEAVYSVLVPHGKALTATATPISTDDAVIDLIEGPASKCTDNATCLDGADSAGVGGAETATYTNSSATDKTVFIVVGGSTPADITFNLLVTVN